MTFHELTQSREFSIKELEMIKDQHVMRDKLMKKNGLTYRECEILFNVAEGAGNREVGDALGVKETTVKFHLGRIFKKLGISRRSQIVLLVHDKNGRKFNAKSPKPK